MSVPAIDYSLYLVTGRDLLPPGKDYYESLEESLRGGVTVVQIREKETDTGQFLEIAQKSKEICSRYNVPIIINDRIDIALAMGADGVHVGQTDMPVAIARKLLPSGTIIGVSCSTIEEIAQARRDGADYVGIGAIWGTQTKKLTKEIVRVRGVGDMLRELDGTDIKAVVIGGIKTTNALHLLQGSVSSTGHALDGLAVVSDIVASPNPEKVAESFRSILTGFRTMFGSPSKGLSITTDPKSILQAVGALLQHVRALNPVVHQITNNVVTNQSANATLALGASPIMATARQEMQDLTVFSGALLINFGTITDIESMKLAGHWMNRRGKPVVFDPVGVGATGYRRSSADELLNAWIPSIIKGNAGELATLAKSTEVASKGVDAAGGFQDPAAFVRKLAQRERSIVVLTGVQDYISDGTHTVCLSNGHEHLGMITGSGCMVGTCCAVFAAAANDLRKGENNNNQVGRLISGGMFAAAVGGVLAVTIAAEVAAGRQDVKGPGTFLPALIDELANLTPGAIAGRARIEFV